KFPYVAVNVVRARSRNDVCRRSQRASELGICVERDDAELADRVHRRLEDESAVDAVEVVRAVNKKVIRFRPLAIDRISLPIAQRSAGFGDPRRQRNDSRLQQTKLGEVASVQRQVFQFALLYDLAQAG